MDLESEDEIESSLILADCLGVRLEFKYLRFATYNLFHHLHNVHS